MPALYEGDGTTDARERRRSRARRSLTAPVAVASLAIALTLMLGSPGSSSADNGPNDVDVDPDSASHTVGDLVTLTAVLTAGTDAGSTGQVTFYFLPGSPNDTAGAPDYSCDGSTGLCSISYTATNAGVDVVCATSRTVPDGCAEPWATDDTTSTDVVQRIVSAPTPTPTPSPTPTPTPTPTPAPTPPPPTGWSFTVTPSSVVQGSTNDFVARVGHTSSGGNTGCSIVQVAAEFTILSAQVVGTSQGQNWTATVAGNQIWIVADGGSDKISDGQWVDVAVRATATQTGTLGWAATGSSTSTCTSEPSYLPGQTAWVTVTTSNPTPIPTPVPTPDPTPVPTPDPTPVPAPVVPPPPPPPPAPAPVQPPPPPAPVTSSNAATPTPAPSPRASGEHVIPLAEDPNAGAPPVTAPVVEAPDPPLAAPAAPAPAPAAPDLLSQIVDAAADGIGRAVSPEAAAQVATTFGFPLALMLAVFLFLVVQDRVDRRDPKLRTAPRTFTDTVVRFKEEHEL